MAKSNLSKYFFAAVGGLCALFIFGMVFILLSGTKPADESASPAVGGEVTKAVVSAARKKLSSALVATSGEVFTVVRVIDGDTIEVSIGGKTERVRYIGMNTPETVDPRKPVQCFGREASQKNRDLVEGKEVRLEKDITDRDAYGRLLRYVFVGDTFVNRELVQLGYATVYTFPPNVKYAQKFLVAQKEAHRGQRGLWQACQSGKMTSSIMPQAVTSLGGNISARSGGCNIKGNINARGEKIYHFPGCSYYGKTAMDESKGERWFCSEKEALKAGWRKVGNCP